jgi:hypothetical protein
MKKRRLLYSTLLGLVLLFGCKKEDPEKIGPCGVKDPITELPWLKEEIIRLSSRQPGDGYAYFTHQYKGERVFWLYYAFSSDFSKYRTCDGSIKYAPIPSPNDSETTDFRKLLGNPTLACPYIIWNDTTFNKYVKCK